MDERFEVDRVVPGADASLAAADLVIVDAAFLLEHRHPIEVPSVVLLGPGADRRAVTPLAPEARAWLPMDSTGDELIEAVERALARPSPRERHETADPTFAPRTSAELVASPGREAAVEGVAELAAAVVAADPVAVQIALALVSVVAGAISLAFIWMAIAP